MEDALYSLMRMMYAFFKSHGYLGLGLSMFVESVGIPFASAFFVLTAGTFYLRGTLTVMEILGIGTLGIVAGSIVSYAMGYYGKKIRDVFWLKLHYTSFGKYQGWLFSVNRRERREKYLAYLKKYGFIAIVLAQLFGLSRTFISFPAGAMGIKFFPFVLFTAIGGALFSMAALLGSILLVKTFRLFIGLLEYLPILYYSAALFGVLLFCYVLYRIFHRKK